MKKRFTSEDMKYLKYISSPVISENGLFAAYVESTGDEDTGVFTSTVHVLRTSDMREVYRTRSGHSEKQPVFAGEIFTYLSDETGEWQLYKCCISTGVSEKLTSLRHGLVRYSLNCDGTEAVFECTLWPEETEKNLQFTEMSENEKKSWFDDLDMKPYEATDLTYKMDEWYGMRKGEFSHIGIISIGGTERNNKINASIFDLGSLEAVYPSISHDGRTITFFGYPHKGAQGRQAELFMYIIEESELVQLTDNIGIWPDHFPVFSLNDHSIITAGFPPFEDGSTALMPYEVKTTHCNHETLSEKWFNDSVTGFPFRFMIDEWDERFCSGMHPIVAGRTEWGDHSNYFSLTADGRYLYFQTSFRGYGNLCRVGTEEGSYVEIFIKGKSDIAEFCVSDSGSVIYTMGNAYEPLDVYIDGTRVTFSNEWLNEYELGKVEEHWTKSADGNVELQWFLVYPAGYEEGKRYPAVLDVKGGPETTYNLSFWHEFQAIAGEEIAVIYGSPRGSTGYGRFFCRNAVCWKTEAMEDLLTMVDAACGTGIVDPDKLGVTGGSYGGYMTMKLIGRTDRFKAAAAQRPLANPVTSYGTGDMGFISSRPVPEGFSMKEFLIDRAKGNVISYIDQMKTPLLILHGYEDRRCGFEQAEQIFIPMRERNPEVPCRMVVFTGENHGITRTGKLYNQIRHLKEITAWMKMYLKDSETEAKDGY